MPVDLDMLVSASPPLYAYSAFVDSQYTRFTSDGYCPTPNCERGYSIHENFFNDTHLQYSEIGSTFNKGESYKVVSPNRHIPVSGSQTYTCSYDQTDNKSREKKRVSFADDKGLALVEVRSIPHSPHTAPKWAQNIFSFITGGIKSEVATACERKWKVAFEPKDLSTFTETLENTLVALGSVSVKQAGSEDKLSGMIKVKNITFSKDVFLRITFDRWVTYQDIPCIYTETTDKVTGCSLMPGFDAFTFEVTIPHSALRYEVVEFCICFRENGQEHWDNNGGINYRLVASPAAKTANVVKEVPPTLKEPVSPKFAPISEHFTVCPTIDAWEALLNEQPYW